jgi:hypothetical protein
MSLPDPPLLASGRLELKASGQAEMELSDRVLA